MNTAKSSKVLNNYKLFPFHFQGFHIDTNGFILHVERENKKYLKRIR